MAAERENGILALQKTNYFRNSTSIDLQQESRPSSRPSEQLCHNLRYLTKMTWMSSRTQYKLLDCGHDELESTPATFYLRPLCILVQYAD